MTADRLVPRRRGQDQRKPRTRSLPSPLWGGSVAKRRGGGRYEARASRHNNDPRPPTPPHKGGGERTEFVARSLAVTLRAARLSAWRGARGRRGWRSRRSAAASAPRAASRTPAPPP